MESKTKRVNADTGVIVNGHESIIVQQKCSWNDDVRSIYLTYEQLEQINKFVIETLRKGDRK